MVNLKTAKVLRDRQYRSRQLQQIPEPSRPLGGERRAKKADSAGAPIKTLFEGEESQFLIFDCDNCGGTHKSMICKSDCRLCKSKGLDSHHIRFHCPKILNAVDKKKLQWPRTVTESPTRSVKSAASRSKKPAGSVISIITQDYESFADEDSEVREYPVWVDTCASAIYTPRECDLDSNSSRPHSRDMVRLNVEQADGTRLVSSGIGKLAGVPAYVMSDMSETLLGANVVCKLGNLILVDDKRIICVSSNESTRAALKAFYDFIRQNKDHIKFTAYADNGCYKVLRSKISTLTNKNL